MLDSSGRNWNTLLLTQSRFISNVIIGMITNIVWKVSIFKTCWFVPFMWAVKVATFTKEQFIRIVQHQKPLFLREPSILIMKWSCGNTSIWKTKDFNMTKGTQSFGKRHNKTHTLCRRTGRSNYHIQKKTSAKMGQCKFYTF